MKRRNLMKWHFENEVSQTDVAKYIGVTDNHYSLVIKGKANPSFRFIEKFCEYAEKHGYVIEDVWELFKKE